MTPELTPVDRFGLVRPAIDCHTLGLGEVAQMLRDSGYPVVAADLSVCRAVEDLRVARHAERLTRWIRRERITRIGFSYRLDPEDGAEYFGRFFRTLDAQGMLSEHGGPIRAVAFAGLPSACARVREAFGSRVATFQGDETPRETLERLGLREDRLPAPLAEELRYDALRMEFAAELLSREEPARVRRVDRSGYPEFGGPHDTLLARLEAARLRNQPPLIRVHVGPFLPDRREALTRLDEWLRDIARSDLVDIASLATSQLTQALFGEDWGDHPNGGGAPINEESEYAAAWQAARPMLVRTYAGTKNLPALARMYDRRLHIAWHALSLWWFCRIDGRGPNSVADNLEEHAETLRFVASTDKPYEPNVSHHFAFRGGDDVTFVVSSVLAARFARKLGIRTLVLQVMLNTPKGTWGVQDLAKARATLHLTRQLEDGRFRVILQPRAGLDYFSHDLDRARAQLAATTALMQDIEPDDARSPAIVHVVSYSEASHLADPPVIEESVRIVRAALAAYPDWSRTAIDRRDLEEEVASRTARLLRGARAVLSAIEESVPDPYSARGLGEVFRAGFLPVPHLTADREAFPHAVGWSTRVAGGGVEVVDGEGRPVPAEVRAAAAAEVARAGPDRTPALL